MAGIRVKNGINQGQTFTITEDPITIGRDESCTLSLQDKGASRRHAEIFKIGDMCFIRDLESKNGTFINDNRVTEEMLREGDRIQIGGTSMVFDPLIGGGSDSDIDFSEEEIDSYFELRLEDLTAANVGEGDASSEPYLRALYRLSRLLASEDREDELIRKALAFAAEAVHADGAYVFGRDPRKGTIITLGQHIPDGAQQGQLSRTIIRKVLHDKRALLVTDAMRDARFASNESVMRHNIHAVICTPMQLYDGAESVLYLAGDDPAVSFNERELELAAAMADQMGIALSRIASKFKRREYMLAVTSMLLQVADRASPGIRDSNLRIAGYARAIGRAMGLDMDMLERLQMGAMLYNYSLMAGRGDAEQPLPADRMRDTAALLSREIFWSEIEPIISNQLEKYNGTGPRRLKGTELPLEARVFQIALDLEETLGDRATEAGITARVTEMMSLAGMAYDPDVMRAVSIADKGHSLGMPLEEQWRQRRSSRLTSFLQDE